MNADFLNGMMDAEQIVSDEAERIWKMRDATADPTEKLAVGCQSQAVAKAAKLIRDKVKATLDKL